MSDAPGFSPTPPAPGATCPREGPNPPAHPVRDRLPACWLVLLFLLGLFPWCEVSCREDGQWRVLGTQSGYQALVPDPNPPRPEARDEASLAAKNMRPCCDLMAAIQRTRLRAIEVDTRSWLVRTDPRATVSPVLLPFWVTAFAATLAIAFLPATRGRLALVLAASLVLFGLLLTLAVAGLPAEQPFYQEPDPDRWMTRKTPYFWATLAAVAGLALTEVACGLTGRRPRESFPAAATLPLALAAVGFALLVQDRVRRITLERLADKYAYYGQEEQRLVREHTRQQELAWQRQQREQERERQREAAWQQAAEDREVLILLRSLANAAGGPWDTIASVLGIPGAAPPRRHTGQAGTLTYEVCGPGNPREVRQANGDIVVTVDPNCLEIKGGRVLVNGRDCGAVRDLAHVAVDTGGRVSVQPREPAPPPASSSRPPGPGR